MSVDQLRDRLRDISWGGNNEELDSVSDELLKRGDDLNHKNDVRK